MRTLSVRGEGWWYDQRLHRYVPISDHTVDALLAPRRFRLNTSVLTRMTRCGLVSPHSEALRAEFIPYVCNQGFIRVRLLRDTLGWQFAGEPHTPLDVLRRFARRHEVGGSVLVTYTSFGFGEIEQRLSALLNDGAPVRDFLHRWDTAQEAAWSAPVCH